MNYNEVKKKVRDEFTSFLKPIGFKVKASSQGCDFFKEIPDGYQKIGFGISNYDPVFYTGVYSYIGIDQMDLVLCKALGIDYSKSISGGGTLYTSTAIYFNEINFQFKILTENNIFEWINLFKMYYYDHFLPFSEKYNSIEAIDNLLNQNPTEKVMYLDDLGWRIIKGLIAAKLNNNPKYNELRDYYFGVIDNANKKLLETKNRGFLMYEKCMKTIEFLDRHSQEELSKITESA